jgi:NAD(P)-dependent dehydrogenase (short-subunit alcohol dehydrogenase family)
MSPFATKTVLVTGGTTGIGLATAQQFAAQGATVIVTGRNPDTLQAARDALPTSVHVWKSDASDPEAVQALFSRVHSELGGLDVLFLNAGVALFAPLDQASLDEFDRQFGINVRGPWLAIKHAAPVLNDGASVLLNASAVWSKGMAGGTIYNSTKAALRALVRSAAVELAPRGIRVNSISPGPIETPIYGKMGMPEDQLNAFAQGIQQSVPLGRFGRADEIASAALFLSGPGASYINAVDLPVDGGFAQV